MIYRALYLDKKNNGLTFFKDGDSSEDYHSKHKRLDDGTILVEIDAKEKMSDKIKYLAYEILMVENKIDKNNRLEEVLLKEAEFILDSRSLVKQKHKKMILQIPMNTY